MKELSLLFLFGCVTALRADSGFDARPLLPDSEEIAYDDGAVRTWWCSDKDSFGAAVKFTPREYPCNVYGGRAPIHYDMGTNIYVRLFDDDGTAGNPLTLLAEARCIGVPHNADSSFKEYDFSGPVRIDSGDFYICFWQKSYFNLVFASDAAMNHAPRQWWFLPPQGWCTPYGMNAADQLIRAVVSYPGTGIVEESANPLPGPLPQLLAGPNPCRGMLSLRLANGSTGPGLVTIGDASGRLVRRFVLEPCVETDLDLRDLPDGLYFAQFVTGGQTTTAKLILQR
jgi:hypothetical protein